MPIPHALVGPLEFTTCPVTRCLRHRRLHLSGAHILSGNVFEPRALDELLPAWRESGAPVGTEAANDSFLALTETGSIAIPNLLLPPQLHNEVRAPHLL